MLSFFPYCLFVSNSQVIGCEDRHWNDLYCVGWGVKLYSIQSNHLVSTKTFAWSCSHHLRLRTIVQDIFLFRVAHYGLFLALMRYIHWCFTLLCLPMKCSLVI